MNLYLLQSVGKWLTLLVVSAVSLFGGFPTRETEQKTISQNITRNSNIVSTITTYKTEYQYDSSLPSNVKKVLVEGIDGLSYLDPTTKQEQILIEPVNEVIQVGTGGNGTYTGRMTAYGPDCVGCSKVGNVGCLTKDGTKHSLISDGIYYQDEEYGKVRILAAATSKFTCGTIVYVDNGIMEPFYGVVLDSGSSMRNAWNAGTVWMDLAFSSQEEALSSDATSRKTKYQVQRWGW